MQRQGISPEMYYHQLVLQKKIYTNNLKAKQKHAQKQTLVIEAVAKAENIEVTQEDIDAEVKDLAEQYNMPEAQVRKSIKQRHVRTRYSYETCG